MKIGDIVRQGTRVIEIRKGNKKQTLSKLTGVIIAIRALPEEMKKSRNGDWSKLLGTKTVDVLWSNGRLMENYAENSLEVINGNE